MENDILFIGAHADDIEIGAGGTVAKLSAKGNNVWLCILTDDPDSKSVKKRRSESIEAGTILGIAKNHILFAGLPDGHLKADRDSISLLRKLIADHKCMPKLIMTHRLADSHNDHRAAAELTLSTFRETTVFHYSVVNSAIVSDFCPRIFVDTASFKQLKELALKKHYTQSIRMLWEAMEAAESSFGARIGTSRAEAFEVTIQRGASSLHEIAREFNDCSFHAFWYSLLENRTLVNIHGVPVYRKKKEYDWPIDKDRDGMARLRQAFKDRWFGPIPIVEYNCGTERVDALLYKNDVLLSGGAVSNTLARNYFNHFVGLRYVIDYDMPDYKNIRILDRHKMTNIKATYKTDEFGGLVPLIVYCIITVMRNPMHPGLHLIGCMGIHGFGSLGGYLLLSESIHLRQFLEKCPLPIPADITGYQVIAKYDHKDDLVEWDWDTLYKIPLETAT